MKIPHAAYLVMFIWAVFVVEMFIPGSFFRFGILPREMSGLMGILFAPWLHADLWHIISNSLPFLVLGTLIQFKSTEIFWESTVIIAVVAGFSTWLLGSSAYHIGASGLVLGYWSFLIADAFFRKSIKAILIASITLVLYGGFIFIMLDFRAHVSWAGHFSGVVAGIIVAKLYFNSTTKTEMQET